MLVLSRKPGETIRLGDDIVITVVQLKNGRVSIGVEAPTDVKVLRGELAGTLPLPPAPTPTRQSA